MKLAWVKIVIVLDAEKSQDKMIQCIECEKEIVKDADYTFISRRGSSTSVHFHIDCFSAVAGDKYLKHLPKAVLTSMSGGVDFNALETPMVTKSFLSGSQKYRKHVAPPKDKEDWLQQVHEHYEAFQQKNKK